MSNALQEFVDAKAKEWFTESPQEACARMSAEACAAHAAVDAYFDRLEAQQLAAATHAVEAMRQEGQALNLDRSVAAMLKPIREHNFRLRLQAHEELDALVQQSIAVSLATMESIDAPKH